MESKSQEQLDAEAPKEMLRLPPTLLILGFFLVLAAIAAELIPQGSFQREQRTLQQTRILYVVGVEPGETLEMLRARLALPDNQDLFAEGARTPLTTMPEDRVVELREKSTRQRTVVLPGTYERLERPDRSLSERLLAVPTRVLLAPLKGFSSKADIIGFILIIGGAFGIILGTGAIDTALTAGIRVISRYRSEAIVIPVVMVLFSLGGAIFGMSEETIPFVMITIPLAIRLGYDAVTGLCMSWMAAGLGFAGAFFNPFTVGIAQGIAEVPLWSGIGYRFFGWWLLTALGIAYTMHWARKVKKDPELAWNYCSDREILSHFSSSEVSAKFTWRHALVLLSILGAILVIGYGVHQFGWYLEELSAVFFGAGLFAAIVSGIGLSRAAELFTKGAGELVGACLIVAFSAGIVTVLDEANVLDTILHAISSPLDGLPAMIGVWGMFLFQSVLNFFVPSGSGQAAMTMPLMAPLGDLIGISRQTTVLAYQFGDGLSNMIIPTSAVTMSVLGIARIPWIAWLKWVLPLQLMLLVLAMALLAGAIAIDYR